jgi:hypothetical protein
MYLPDLNGGPPGLEALVREELEGVLDELRESRALLDSVDDNERARTEAFINRWKSPEGVAQAVGYALGDPATVAAIQSGNGPNGNGSNAKPQPEHNKWAEWATPIEDITYQNPPRFLVQGLVLANDINFIAGAGGSMKTTGALAIACGVASGTSVFGCDVIARHKVLFVSEEDDATIIKNRADALCAGHGVKIPAGSLQVVAQRGFNFGRTNDCAAFRDFVRSEGFGLVVFDPLAEMLSGNENDNSESRAVVQFLRSITAQGGPAVLIVHHAGKGSDGKSKVDTYMRGASAFKNGARSVLAFTARDGGFKVESLKLNRSKKPEDIIVLADITPDPEDPHGVLWDAATLSGTPAWSVEQTELQAAILQVCNIDEGISGAGLREMLMKAGHGPLEIDKARKWLADRGQLTYRPGKHNAKMWRTLRPDEASFQVTSEKRVT